MKEGNGDEDEQCTRTHMYGNVIMKSFFIICQLKVDDDDNNDYLDNFNYFACPISVSRIPTEKTDSNYGFFMGSFLSGW